MVSIANNYVLILLLLVFIMGLLYLASLLPSYIPHFLTVTYLVLPLCYSLLGIAPLPLTTVFVLVLSPFILLRATWATIARIWVILPYIIFVLLSSYVNHVPLQRSFLIPVVISTSCYLVFSRPGTETALKHFVYLLIGWGLINSIFSLLQIFVSDSFYVYSVTKTYKMTNIKRGYGLIGMATHVGLHLCFIVSLMAAVFLDSKKHQKILFSLAAILVVGLFLSFSRAAILGAAAGIFVVLLGQKSKGYLSMYLAALLLLALGYFLYINLLPGNYSHFFQGKDGSARARAHFVFLGIKMFLDKPLLGWGYGGFANNVVKYGSPVKIEAHNTFIQVLVEYGILGFSAFVVLIINSLRGYLLCFRRCVDQRLKTYSLGFLAATIAVFIDGYFHCFEWTLIFWLLIILGYVMRYHAQQQLSK